MEKITKILDLDARQLKLLFSKLGGSQGIEKILKSKTAINADSFIFLEDGRFIPSNGMDVCEPDLEHPLSRPHFTNHKVLEKCHKYFPGLQFAEVGAFHWKIESLLSKIKKDPLFSGLLDGGVYLPICLPQIKVDADNYGKIVTTIFLKAVAKAYQDNSLSGGFLGPRNLEHEQINIVNSSHRHLLAKLANGPVPGIMFFPFQGFSFKAVQAISRYLPNSMVLPGAIGLITALTVYNKTFFSGFSSLQYQSGGITVGKSFAERSIYLFLDHNGTLVCKIADTERSDGKLHTGLLYIGN